LETGRPSILAHRCEWKGGAVVAVHNLAKDPVTVRVDLGEGERLVELLGDRRHQGVDNPRAVELAGYGYRWFRLGGASWKSA
jgi:maltose alpha-D-glucosyltransferase/alpha-amylase